MKVIYGIANKDKGKIFIMGKEVEIRNPRDAIRNGIGMVPFVPTLSFQSFYDNS